MQRSHVEDIANECKTLRRANVLYTSMRVDYILGLIHMINQYEVALKKIAFDDWTFNTTHQTRSIGPSGKIAIKVLKRVIG